MFRVIQTIQCHQQGLLHYMCSWLSNPYNVNSLAPHFCSLLFSLSLLRRSLYVFRDIRTIQCHQQGLLHYMCSQLSNPYNINSLAPHFCPLLFSLSLFSGGHCMCSGLSEPYNATSRVRCIIYVHGYLTHIISTALLPTFTHCFPLPLFSDDHWRDLYIANFGGCGCWKVMVVGIHSQPCCERVFVAIGIHIYLAVGVFICLAVGLWVWKVDSNCCSYLLSTTAPVLRAMVIGDPVARFACHF